MVERLFLLKRCFLPFQFAGQTSADTFEASPICARVVCKTTVVFNIFNFMSHSTSDMESAWVDLSEVKVGAIINTSSGGCDAESEAEMLDLLKGANVSNCKTWCGESDQIERAFAEAAMQELKILIVLGGDGTIRTAAEACTGTGTCLLPLRGGTLNMLPRALYGDASWQNALKDTLADPAIKMLSGGRVADANALFFVAAVVGAPGLWMEAREAMREGDILDAVHKGGIAFLKQCLTQRYNILFHQKLVAKLKSSRLSAPLYRSKCPTRSKRLKPLRLLWRMQLKYSGSSLPRHLVNGARTKG